MDQYEKYTDEELIRMLRNGDSGIVDYLMEKYKSLVRRKSNTLFLLGGDTDDIIQEGMIGLFKAVQDYDEALGSFSSFAELCISRQIYTAIEAAARKKHGPLNTYVSLSEGQETGVYQVEDDPASGNPEQILIDKESVDLFLKKAYDRLSRMERQVLDYHLRGMNYRQIAEQMGKSEKSIDNALQRIRQKIQKM